MPDLSEDDVKFVLSVDPDQEALNKALEQINAEIDRAQVEKIKLQLEPPKDVLPLSFWEVKFGKAGEALAKELSKAAEVLSELKIGADPTVLRERVQQERLVAAARRDLEKAERAERERQAGGSKNLLREQMGLIPDDTKERIRRERERADVQKELEAADHAERVRQAGGKWGYAKEQLKGLFSPGGKGGMGAVMGGLLGGQGGGGALGQVGGMAGMALGGPAGAEMGSMLAKMIPEKLAGPAKAMTGALEGVGSSLRGIQGPLGPVGAGLDMLSGGLDMVFGKVKDIPIIGEILGPMLDQFGKLPGVFKDILEAIVPLVAKAAPGVVKQLSLAVENFQATVGQAFVPVVEFMIDMVRDLADVMAEMLPSADEVKAALEPLRDAWLDLRDTLKEIAPDVHQGLVTAFKVIGAALAGFVKTLEVVVRGIHAAWRMLTAPLRWLGLMGEASEQRSGQQAITAARTPWMGGIEEYQRQMQMRVLEYSAGGGRKLTQEDTYQNVSSLVTMVKDIQAWFLRMTPEYIVNLIGGAFVPDMGREIVRGAELDAQIARMQAKLRAQGVNLAGGAGE